MPAKLKHLPTAGDAVGGTEPGEGLEALLVAVANGDREAFAKAFDRLSGPVYGVVLRVLRDPAQAEEVAQEVLLAVWRCASRFDASRGSAVAWVMTMSHRRAVDRVRSEQSAATRNRRLGMLVGPEYGSVAETVHVQLEHEAVRRSLACLSEVQRESIVLAYYGGLSYREVAEHLGVPLGTVKSRIRDGLIRLRDCLGAAA